MVNTLHNKPLKHQHISMLMLTSIAQKSCQLAEESLMSPTNNANLVFSSQREKNMVNTEYIKMQKYSIFCPNSKITFIL